jgi:hypothetical protein
MYRIERSICVCVDIIISPSFGQVTSASVIDPRTSSPDFVLNELESSPSSPLDFLTAAAAVVEVKVNDQEGFGLNVRTPQRIPAKRQRKVSSQKVSRPLLPPSPGPDKVRGDSGAAAVKKVARRKQSKTKVAKGKKAGLVADARDVPARIPSIGPKPSTPFPLLLPNFVPLKKGATATGNAEAMTVFNARFSALKQQCQRGQAATAALVAAAGTGGEPSTSRILPTPLPLFNAAFQKQWMLAIQNQQHQMIGQQRLAPLAPLPTPERQRTPQPTPSAVRSVSPSGPFENTGAFPATVEWNPEL